MRKLLLALVLLCNTKALCQENLVLNPGLEKYSFCPSQFDEIRAAENWNCLDTVGATKGVGFPEYMNTCGTDPSRLATVPENGYFFQYPHQGRGMAQIQVFSDETMRAPFLYYKRDYLQGRLYKKLSAGKSYCVTIYVNLEEASGYAIQDIGAYLDNGLIDTATDIAAPQTHWHPQVSNTSGILADTAAWVRIQGSFIAKGDEQFITIGNFKDLAHTTYAPVSLNHYNNGVGYTWYLVDDVSVIESDLPAFAGNDRHIGLGDSTYVGRPQEVGLECTWAKLGSSTVIGTGAGIWVKPSTSTSYVVTQTLCGAVKKDTVLVEVWPLGLSSVNGQTQGYSLLPNPNKGQFELVQFVLNNAQMQVTVCDVLGRTIYKKSIVFSGKKAKIDIGDTVPGVYLLKLDDGIAPVSIKFVVR